MIRAKVNIKTAKNEYAPGEKILEKLSAADMKFLKKHHFIMDEEEETAAEEGKTDSRKREKTLPPVSDEKSAGGQQEESGSGEDGILYRDEASLRKMNKDEIVAYAAGIGMTLEETSLKNDLIDAVLNYQEEHLES